MQGAFEWLNKLFEFLWQFVPKPVIVPMRGKALRTRTLLIRDLLPYPRVRANGPRWTDCTWMWMWWDPTAKVATLPPGFVIYWPVVTDLELYPTAYQTTPLVAQDIVTTDGKTFTARGMLSYEIEDLVKIYAETYDPEDTIKDLGATAFHNVLCHRSSEELVSEQGSKIDTKLRNEAKKTLAPRGVKVHNFTLTSLAPARVLRVVQSTSQEGELK